MLSLFNFVVLQCKTFLEVAKFQEFNFVIKIFKLQRGLSLFQGTK